MPESQRRYQDLLEAIRMVSVSLDSDAVLDFILPATIRLSRAEAASLVLVDEERGDLYFRTAKGTASDGLSTIRMPKGKGVVGWVIDHGKPLLVEDVTRDSRFNISVDQDTGFTTESIICVPLQARGKTIGALEVINSADARTVSDEATALLSAFAAQAALAIDNARRYSEVVQDRNILQQELDARHQMICPSKSMTEVMEIARKAAPTTTTVLIQGESGTGKELVARAIHHLGPRADKPFVAVNCASLSEELLASELFGHEKGAFTGAYERKRGKMELARDGTFFLDEVGEMKPSLQAKFLRVLQERIFERLGGTEGLPLRCRIVCATNRDLREALASGTFRTDLFYRLNVIGIHVPPLRARTEEILPLTQHFLARGGRGGGRKVTHIDSRAARMLEHYSWPGNVRELENVVERALVLGSGETLVPEDLPPELRGERPGDDGEERVDGMSYRDAVREMKRQILRRAIMRAGGRQKDAAAALQIQPSYLSKLMADLDLREGE